MSSRLALPLLFSILLIPAASASTARELTFEERVEAQRAIERVYYAHEESTRRPFDEAINRELLERKVRTYLKQSVALERFWNTPVTSQMLECEWERIARGSWFPERLQEIYEALDNDPVVIQECLVRSVVVDRLARSFFAHDGRIHGAASEEAEALRAALVRRKVDRAAEHPRRTVAELVRAEDPEPAPSEPIGKTNQLFLTSEEWERWRARMPAAGDIGAIEETDEALVIRVILDDRGDHARVATYSVQKRSWEDWWGETAGGLDESVVRTVASGGVAAPQVGVRGGPACFPTDSWDAGALDDTPQFRSGHVALWTGSQMLVWGGAVQDLRRGHRYDPATDTWTAMSRIGAPEGGQFSPFGTAVWTGTEMLAWNGTAGGRYNPATDTWTPMSAIGGPPAATAVWTGSEMIVWSGIGGRYDPGTDTWTPTSTINAPVARSGHRAVWTGSVMVVWGGQASNAPNVALNTGGRYDPATNTWTATSLASAPVARSLHTALWTGSRVIVWGGSNSNTGGYYDDGGSYDPVGNVWTAIPTGPLILRRQHSAVWTGTEMIIWGGTVPGPGNMNAGRYDPVTGNWTVISVAGELERSYSHSAVWTGNLMIVWGGSTDYFSSDPTNTGGRYDAILDAWAPTSTAGVPAPRGGHVGLWTGNEMLIWGGGSPNPHAAIPTGGRYDPVSDTWQAMADSPGGLQDTAAVWTGLEMLVFGGISGSTPTNVGARYSLQTNTWSPMSSTPPSLNTRFGARAVWTGSVMVVWGGRSSTGLYWGDGGRYDPATDTWLMTANHHPGRVFHTAVWTGQEMVVWGGEGAGNTGGRYDPVGDLWTATSTVGAPSARYDHSAVFSGGKMIVWGGYQVPNSGGVYDPATDSWSATSLVDAPNARRFHSAVWGDVSMFIWGGVVSFSEIYNDGSRYSPDSDDDGLSDSCDNCRLASNPGQADQDSDGIGDACDLCPAVPDADLDLDGVTNCTDCDDSDASVRPGAPQICDGQNNDCSDPGWPAVPANESDGDMDGVALCQSDCDDARSSVRPGGTQVCDGLNNDCSHPSWPGLAGTNEAAAAADTFNECLGDCDDGEPAVHPGATEVCNAVDDDCDSLTNEDALGEDTDTDGVRNLCDNCPQVVNPSQLDSDADGRGNSCENCISVVNPDQADGDSDGRGNVCDNCPQDANASQSDLDADRTGDTCDNCAGDYNPSQSDLDTDFEGDVCDLDDGLIYIVFGSPGFVEWQEELGFDSWNSYRGDLAVLKTTGVYTQASGSNPLVQRDCGLGSAIDTESGAPPTGQAAFWLVTGVSGAVEGGLGTNSSGAPRPNANPCP